MEIMIGQSHERLEQSLLLKYPSAALVDGGLTSAACLQLDEYFSGHRRNFSLPLDWSGRTPFAVSILQQLAHVPFGETKTYGELARFANFPGCARAVGQVMATNRLPLILPCHRVIGCGGHLTGYSGGDGIKTKQWLLDFEKSLMKNKCAGL